jgi:hypothetical protein
MISNSELMAFSSLSDEYIRLFGVMLSIAAK